MQYNIKIKPMHPVDRPDVLSFLRAAYPDNPRQSDPRFWDWHFPGHPLADPGKPPIWLAKSGDRIAGQLACIPVNLRVKEKNVTATWILDLMVDPEFRRRGIMKNLVREVQKVYPALLGVNTNQQHAPALLQSLGWKIVSLIPRYHRLLFPGSDIKHVSPSGMVAKAVNLAFSPFRPRSGGGINPHLRSLTGFDRSFDDLWLEAREQWPCAVNRSVATLNWQYRTQPGKKFEIIGWYDAEQLRGYAVMYYRKARAGCVPKAAISDICYHPSNPVRIVDELIEGCIQLALERRAGGVVVDVMDELLRDRLRRAGFLRVNSPLQLMAWATEGQEEVLDPKNWFLTRGDSDISIFEQPNQ